jgi:hypothetical protein
MRKYRSGLMHVHRQTAQTLTLIAIALPVIGGMIGLATDVGSYYLNGIKLQDALDVSVLSGVQYLPGQPCNAIATANMYASCLNGVGSKEVISTTISDSGCSIPTSVPVSCPTPTAPTGCSMPLGPPSASAGCKLSMLAQRKVPFFFGSLVGVGSGTLKVAATAVYAPTSSTDPAPIGLQGPIPYAEGSATSLTFEPYSPTGIPVGSWSALQLGNTFRNVFPGTYSVEESIGNAMLADRTATTAGPIAAAVQERVSAGSASFPADSYSSYTPNDPRAITIVLTNWNPCCTVQGFAELWLDSVDERTAIISGHWISRSVPGAADTTGTAPNDGALTISLTQ